MLPLTLLIALSMLERLRPLRRLTQRWSKRAALNLSVGLFSALVLRLTFYPLLLTLSQWVTQNGMGLFAWLGFSSGATRFGVSFLVMDWALYLWHRANHRFAFLWRFHSVHHTDLDLDVTTAARFHLGELALSSLVSAALIVVFGIESGTWLLFQLLVTSAAQFHHANFKLPLGWERLLNRLIVTPRMHGVHHSMLRVERDSNYSTVLSIWDRIHHTMELRRWNEEFPIGVPEWSDPAELTWTQCLILPFVTQRK